MRSVPILGSIIFTAALSLTAQTGGDERASTDGARLYTTYCAECHGTEGRRPGAVASVRGSTIPDLQLMATRNRGVFPLAQVEKLLSGTARAPISHGGIEMPLWGPVLSRDGPDRSARVHALARYLETLQK